MSCCSACGKHACACGCGAIAGTPLPICNRPGLTSLEYRVGTWADFRATMQADLSDAALTALAGLRTREADDPAIALLDAWAVGADVLSFYQERIANEGYLRTATERRSVLELARLVDYRLRPGVAASVYLAYTIEQNAAPVTIPAGARSQSVPAPGEQMQTFETAEPLDARYEWNALQPRQTQPQEITWDGISGGAIDTIWLTGTASNLKANDRLLFQFGDLASGQSEVRLVHSIEAQTQTDRTKVVLQPQDATSVQLLAAARTALAVLAGQSAEQPWIDALSNMCREIVQGTRWDNSSRLMNSVFEGLDANVAAESNFVTTVQTILDGSVASPQGADFNGLFRALSLSPTLQPANSVRLARNVAVALGSPSDTRPQLLLNFAPRLADSFYRAWTSVAQSQASPALSAVYAMRVAAPLFGYNAPKTITITQAPGSTAGSTVTTTGYTEQTAQDESDGTVSLDNAYDGIEVGSYVAIQKPGDNVPGVWMATSVNTAPRTDYGISGKTTTIVLADKLINGQPTAWPKPTMSDIRGTVVHAQSELLTLTELVIGDTVGNIASDDTSPRLTADDATHLTLDGAVDGLKPGRWAIVQGQRTDVPGTNAVNAAELVMIAAVEQGTDADLPGDTVHSTLVFANQGLAYAYRRDTVTVCANVARATHGETRNEVLGSGSGATAMQAFVLKQSPLTWVSAATVDGVQSTLSVRVNDMQWHETRNLAFMGAADRNFVTATDNGGKTTVQFGDGSHGARLPTGVENVVASYRNGIGTPGNVNAQQISLLATRPLGVKAVVNPLRASGGADAETRDQARGNVPLAVLALDRLVSVPDYADFARTFGGVGKAAAIKLGNRVQVSIAGAADAPIDNTSDLYRNLLQALQQYGDPSLPVGLDVRELLALTLSAKVGLAPDYAWESVEPALRAALLDAFGFERRALAQNVYLSEVVACMQAVRGVAWADVDAFDQADEQRIIDGLGGGNSGNGKGGDGANLAGASTRLLQATATAPWPALLPTVQALPARFGTDGVGVLPAQLACFLPDVPDTLLLQEAAP